VVTFRGVASNKRVGGGPFVEYTLAPGSEEKWGPPIPPVATPLVTFIREGEL
jgi:hypothetical protein